MPNFILLDTTMPDVARLVVAMLQARDAVDQRSWSHPQEPTGEEWWADVLADARARKRERRTDLAVNFLALTPAFGSLLGSSLLGSLCPDHLHYSFSDCDQLVPGFCLTCETRTLVPMGTLPNIRRSALLSGHPLHGWSKRKLRKAMLAYERDVAESLHGFVAKLEARLGHGRHDANVGDQPGGSLAGVSRGR